MTHRIYGGVTKLMNKAGVTITRVDTRHIAMKGRMERKQDNIWSPGWTARTEVESENGITEWDNGMGIWNQHVVRPSNGMS